MVVLGGANIKRYYLVIWYPSGVATIGLVVVVVALGDSNTQKKLFNPFKLGVF